jgi:hypothetical protein
MSSFWKVLLLVLSVFDGADSMGDLPVDAFDPPRDFRQWLIVQMPTFDGMADLYFTFIFYLFLFIPLCFFLLFIVLF